MSAKLYSLRIPKFYHMITIANNEEDATLIFKKQFNNLEPIEILVFDKKCSLSNPSCETCEGGSYVSCCSCSSIICAKPLPEV